MRNEKMTNEQLTEAEAMFFDMMKKLIESFDEVRVLALLNAEAHLSNKRIADLKLSNENLEKMKETGGNA